MPSRPLLLCEFCFFLKFGAKDKCSLCPTSFPPFHGTERSQGRSTWHSKAVRPRDRCCLHLVLAPYDLCCTLTDDHTGSHGVTGTHAWHDRSVRNAEVVDAVNFEIISRSECGINRATHPLRNRPLIGPCSRLD